ncbi:MAG: hypothetical protein ABWZ66_06045 [Pyrinomonadaceae bacterium]
MNKAPTKRPQANRRAAAVIVENILDELGAQNRKTQAFRTVAR